MQEQLRPLKAWEWIVLIACLGLFVVQAALASPRKSAAFDEEYHVAAGYAYLKTGDFRMSTSHPPLVNALSALPLLLRDDIALPIDSEAWASSDYFIFSDLFLWRANANPQSILEWARWPVIGLGALLALALFFWARQMISPIGGWIALLLATFDPNLLANARLVTTDLGLACFMLLAIWWLWRWLERPSRLNLILTGILVGCTLATKFTGLLILPMLVLILLLYPGYSHRRWPGLLGIGLVGYLTLWAVFRFDVGPVPGFALQLPIPAPFYPYSVWDTFMVIEEQPKPAYLLGQISDRGWWTYFPVALGVKTPLPTLLLGLWGGATMLRRRGWRQSSVVWVPFVLYLGLAMTGRITIGYRHILPVVPFLLMMAAHVGLVVADATTAVWRAWPVRLRVAVGALVLSVAWTAVGTLRLFPHQEAFFNEIAGGPANGADWLVDSNIDWGQDLILLQELLAERGIDDVYLGYFGTALPERYGISYHPLPGFLRQVGGPEIDAFNPYTPLPGWYALSETSLKLGLLLQNKDIYAYFAGQEPVARAGYSINLYRVADEATAVRPATVVGRSVSDMTPAELSIAPGERVVVKWTQSDRSVIWPAGSGELPAGMLPVNAAFGEAFTLLGATLDTAVATPGAPLELTLYWRREAGSVPQPSPATGRPLAAFVHLSGADPAQIMAQVDGWDTALTGLEAGDVIVQRVTLDVPRDIPTGDYYLRVGLYLPQTGDRLTAVVPDGTTSNFITLPLPVQINP